MNQSTKLRILVLLLIQFFVLSGCKKEESEAPTADKPILSKTSTEKSIVVYFSRAGEQSDVGFIAEGNTAVVAKMIALKAGADIFEIKPAPDPYKVDYAELSIIAKREQDANARPTYETPLPDFSQYNVIFIGSPVWWNNWPMIMYSFFDNVPLEGKYLIPFSTHEGSGLASLPTKLSYNYPYCTILKGFSISGQTAQQDRKTTSERIDKWLKTLGFELVPEVETLVPNSP